MSDSTQPNITKTNAVEWQSGRSRGQEYRYKNLGGINLGARIEELPPGQTSSYHHYHTAEEEHVFVLNGNITLVVGEQRIPLAAGDHVCFPAGDPTAHHLANDGNQPCQYFVYGQRCDTDVVVYPNSQTLVIKALGDQTFSYQNAPQTDDT